MHKLSASASPFFEWYPSASSFSKGFPGRACVLPEELFLSPGLHYSLNIKHVLCHYSQHVPGGQFGVVTISFWDYLWSCCQTAPFAKPIAQGGKLPQTFIGTNPSAKSLILSSCFIFLPFDFLVCTFAGWSATSFGFTLILTPQIFPGTFFIPYPTFWPEDTAWGAFQSAMERVEPVSIHKIGGQVLSGTFVVLDSPWDHLNQPTVPCQGNAKARGLHHLDCYCSNLLWHGFDPLQGVLGSGTACPGFGTGQRLSPVSSLDAAAPYQGWKIVRIRMGPALLSWLHGQNGSWKCLISWQRCNSMPQTRMQEVVENVSIDLAYFCFLPSSMDKLFFSSLCSFCWGCFANCITFMAQMSTHPPLHPCQMDGMFTVIVLHIHRQLIQRQESFRPEQINSGNTGITRSLPIPLSCFATHTRHFSSAANPTWIVEEEAMVNIYQSKVQVRHPFQV